MIHQNFLKLHFVAAVVAADFIRDLHLKLVLGTAKFSHLELKRSKVAVAMSVRFLNKCSQSVGHQNGN